MRSRHFDNLTVPTSTISLEQNIIEEFVSPFYMTQFDDTNDTVLSSFVSAAKKIDQATTFKLLEYYDWRTKISGAFFSAINHYTELEEIIGNNLLKSELTYAGYGYCLSLASFATVTADNYLKEYLDYYLTQIDLWYDQATAFCALEHIDKKAAESRYQNWQKFVANKPYWNLDNSRKAFAVSLQNIQRIKQLMLKF